MEIAQLVLEYVKALAWPVLIGVLLIVFRSPISAKIKDITEVTTPVASARMDTAAKALELKAGAALARQDASAHPAPSSGPADEGTGDGTTVVPSPGPSPTGAAGGSDGASRPDPSSLDVASVGSSGHGGTSPRSSFDSDRTNFLAVLNATNELKGRPEFDYALDLLDSSPIAAISVAFFELERVARAAYAVTTLSACPADLSLPLLIKGLGSGVDADFVIISRDLFNLRTRIAHGLGEVSASGALDFIATCERLAEGITVVALSKLRHPSRSGALDRWREEFGLNLP